MSPKPENIDPWEAQLRFQAVDRREAQKADDEESGVNQRVEDAVKRQSLIIALDAGGKLAIEINSDVL